MSLTRTIRSIFPGIADIGVKGKQGTKVILPEVIPDLASNLPRPVERKSSFWGIHGTVYSNPIANTVVHKGPLTQIQNGLRYLTQPPSPTYESARHHMPSARVDLEGIENHSASHPMRFTWISHATCLVQMGGRTFLTDPVFAERCSAFQFIGPKRYTKPALQIEELPPLDFILISHNHYDHLCASSVKMLGNKQLWIVPFGVKSWMNSMGITNCVEMNWWDSCSPSADVKVVALPAYHWSSRTLIKDWNTSLWCGYAVVTNDDERFFFAGDTALCPQLHKAIGEKYGPFDLSALPIGAYLPRHEHTAHCSPSEAVEIHKDLRSRRSVAIHHGTFHLASEGPADAPRELVRALKRHRIPYEQFEVLRHGESILRGQRRKYACKWVEELE